MLLEVKNKCLEPYDKELLIALKEHAITSIFDTNGKIIYANQNFMRISGLPASAFEVPSIIFGKSLVSSKRLFSKIWSVLQHGIAWKGVLHSKGIGNKIYWLETKITPIKNLNGEVVKYITVSNDITNYYCPEKNNNINIWKEQVRIENITKEKLFIEQNGKIFNATASNLNETVKSTIGSHVFDFVHRDKRNCLKRLIDEVFSLGKVRTYQSVGLSSKGNQNFFATKIKPVFNLQNEVIYASLKTKKHDNTFKVNKQLKAIELKYSNIFQSINVGIIVVANGNGIIIEWNKGAENAFGYTDSEIIGEHLSKIISEKHLDSGLQKLLKAKDKLDNNVDFENIEMLGLKKTDEEFPVEFSMSHWKNGKEKFYCAVMLDISKRKKLEYKLKKTTKDLELFLYRSAHDLKAPLTSAEGLLLLLKEETINDRVLELTNMLDETLEKGRLLLDDLALASIISEKRREIDPIIFEEKMKIALIALKDIANFDKVDFQFEIEQDADFYFNQELMDFIFQNLMRNAICFAKPKTKLFAPKANICVKVTKNELHIVVSDNGLGIEKEHLDKVFDLYFSVCKKSCNATGLGLYIVKRIVEEFHGDVSVKSELHKGASFEVILPNIKEEN